MKRKKISDKDLYKLLSTIPINTRVRVFNLATLYHEKVITKKQFNLLAYNAFNEMEEKNDKR